uniref:CopG family ribbon-helix-helix protein n=1 Tax=Thermofilum pendens TaxID=2269 RepID=A0A7C4H746_THEPE
MRRVSVALPDEVYKLLEDLARKTGVYNRSRIIGDSIVHYSSHLLSGDEYYAGAVTVAYDHTRGETVHALVDAQHEHLDIVRSSTHLHVSDDKCVEVLTVEGKGERIQSLISSLRRVSGVFSVQHSLVAVKARGQRR